MYRFSFIDRMASTLIIFQWIDRVSSFTTAALLNGCYVKSLRTNVLVTWLTITFSELYLPDSDLSSHRPSICGWFRGWRCTCRGGASAFRRNGFGFNVTRDSLGSEPSQRCASLIANSIMDRVHRSARCGYVDDKRSLELLYYTWNFATYTWCRCRWVRCQVPARFR